MTDIAARRATGGLAAVDAFVGSLPAADADLGADLLTEVLAAHVAELVGGTVLVVLERDGVHRIAGASPEGDLTRALDAPHRAKALAGLAVPPGTVPPGTGAAGAVAVGGPGAAGPDGEREVLAVLADAGVEHIDGMALAAGGQRLGTLVWCHDPERSPGSDLETVAAIARIAASLLAARFVAETARTRADQLQHALTSRIVVEQAKGMLAEQGGVAPDEAFAVLRAHCRRTNQRVQTVAADVVLRRVGWRGLSRG